MRSSRNAWGGFFPVVLGQQMGQKKEREGQGVGLRWPAICPENATTNHQSALVVGEEWEKDSSTAERRGGTITRRFRGRFERRKIKCKNTLRGGGRQPIDGKNMTTNQSTVSMIGGVSVTSCDRGRPWGEAFSRRLGWRMWGQKNKINISVQSL